MIKLTKKGKENLLFQLAELKAKQTELKAKWLQEKEELGKSKTLKADLEKAKLSWHKTDTEYIKKVIKVIKSL